MDPRTTQTQKNIKEAFINLLATMPIAKISISRLCNEVGIPRQTFYYHYADWQSLVNAIIDDEANRFALLFSVETENLTKRIEQQMTQIERGRNFYHRLEEAGMRNLLFKKLFDRAFDAFFDEWHRSMPDVSREEAELSFRFIAAGYFEVLFDTNPSTTNEQRLRFIEATIRRYRV